MSNQQPNQHSTFSSISVTASPSPSGGGIEYTQVQATPPSHIAIASLPNAQITSQQPQNTERGFITTNTNTNLCMIKPSGSGSANGDPSLVSAEWYWGDITWIQTAYRHTNIATQSPYYRFGQRACPPTT